MKKVVFRMLSLLLLGVCLVQLCACGKEWKGTPLKEAPLYEVYVSQESETGGVCFILPGTHRQKTFGELFEASLEKRMTVEEAREQLDSYGVEDSRIVLYPYQFIFSDYSPFPPSAKIVSAMFDDRYRCADAVQGIYTAEMPDDFSFSVSWGTHSIHRYDSKTQKVNKATNEENIGKFTGDLAFDEADMEEIYTLLTSCIDFFSYPEQFDAANAPDAESTSFSLPSEEIILTVTANGKKHQVACTNLGSVGINGFWCEEVIQWYEVAETIIEKITSTDVWEKLPSTTALFM